MFVKLLEYMLFVAQIPATQFQSWESDFIKNDLFSRMSKIQDRFKSEEIKYNELSLEELKMLGFRPWSEDMDMLIPMWLFRLLPDETPLYCPIGDDKQEVVLRKDADDDYRMGCSAFCLKALRV